MLNMNFLLLLCRYFIFYVTFVSERELFNTKFSSKITL